MFFAEMVCVEQIHNEHLLRGMLANGIRPELAARSVNTQFGRVVCQVLSGELEQYEPGQEKCTSADGVPVPTYVTEVRIKFRNGPSGYVWLWRFELKR